MSVNRLLLQLAILAASYVQIHCVLSLPERLLKDHCYSVDPRESHIHQYEIPIDKICFEEKNSWYRLYSRRHIVPHNRKYFIAWEVKFLQMHSGITTFEISGLEGEANLLVTCKFANIAQFQDFHYETYVDRVNAYSSDMNDARERFQTWQDTIPGASTKNLRWPKTLKSMYDVSKLIKIDRSLEPVILGQANDNVYLFSEEHIGAVDNKPKETYTVFKVPFVAATSRYEPKVQLIFGTDQFSIINRYMYWSIVIEMQFDYTEYYILSFAQTIDAPRVLRHFKEIALAQVEMPAVVEQYMREFLA